MLPKRINGTSLPEGAHLLPYGTDSGVTENQLIISIRFSTVTTSDTGPAAPAGSEFPMWVTC